MAKAIEMGEPRPLGAAGRKVLGKRRCSHTMMSRIFWGHDGAGLQGRQRQDPRTRSAWNLGIF